MGEGGAPLLLLLAFCKSVYLCMNMCVNGNYMNPVQIEYLLKFVKFAKGLALRNAFLN